jgi:hypothetical protein
MIAAMMLAVWLRNKTLAMVVLIVYQFIAEPIIRLVLNKFVWSSFGLYFPMRVITKFIPLPRLPMMEMITENSNLKDLTMALPVWQNLLLISGYSLLFYMITRAILMRRNL